MPFFFLAYGLSCITKYNIVTQHCDTVELARYGYFFQVCTKSTIISYLYVLFLESSIFL